MSTETQFSSVYEFVDNFLVVMYPTTQVRADDVRWTSRWWAHPEAVMRLTALWMRYEQLRQAEPATYIETFLRGHGDYHMARLMAPEGVFDDCRRMDMPSLPLKSDPVNGEKEK